MNPHAPTEKSRMIPMFWRNEAICYRGKEQDGPNVLEEWIHWPPQQKCKMVPIFWRNEAIYHHSKEQDGLNVLKELILFPP